MANFENKAVPSGLDTNWQSGAYVKSLINVEEADPSYKDDDCSSLAFAWFRVESNMQPSQKEEVERQQAIRTQLELKVINIYGMPYGMPMPKEVKEQIKAMEEANAQKSNKWMRKRQKLIDKQIEKDMKKRQREEASKALIQGNSGPENTTTFSTNRPLSSTLSKFLI
jgi:hypothetical protein